jgi:hypothetical protein
MTTGVYKITCLENKKFYIGSSVSCETRWNSHLSALKNGKHHNKHIQSAYNKYGADCFIIEILEECDESVLLDREQFYIDTTQCTNNSIGFNICNKAENGKSSIFDSSKDYIVISPNGTKYLVNNLEAFCRKMGFSNSGLRNVALGRAFQYKNGWHCRYQDESYEDWLLRNNRQQKSGTYQGKWIITYMDGTSTVVDSLHKFCVDNSYSESTIFMLRQGKRNRYKNIIAVDRMDGVS